MKKIVLYSTLMALTFASCDYNEDNFEGFDELGKPTDVKKVEYALTDEDYGTISSDKANIALANADGFGKELGYIKNDKYFTDKITAAKYLPAFLSSRWPTADKGSSVKVTYRKSVAAPEYLEQVEAAVAYKLKATDYALAWGEQEVGYFTPSKAAPTYLPRILKSAFANAEAGTYATVAYQYSTAEPSTGGEVESFDKISDVIQSPAGEYHAKGFVAATYGRGFLLSDGKASILVYLNTVANYSLGDVVTVKGTTSSYSGLMQFPAVSEITKLSPGETFTYPSATAMTGADMDAYLKAPVAKFVKYTGTLEISGNYYNVTNIEGATTAKGSLSYPGPGVITADMNGKKITVYGYTIGQSSNTYVNTMVTAVELEGVKAPASIGMIALAAPGDYEVRGAVAATYSRGFLLNDGTGSVLVYLNKASDFKIGDIVSVSGTTSKYGGLNQFPAASTVTKIADSTFKTPAVRMLNGTELDAYLEKPYAQYVSYTGTLSISGNYYNVTFDDAVAATGSIQYPASGLVDAELDGKKVVVTGYLVGTSGNPAKFVNTMALSVVGAETKAGRALASRAATSETKYAVYKFDGTAWTPGENMSMVNPADYNEMELATNYFVSTVKPENYLPQYLSKTYPYAQEDDKRAVVYFYDNEETIKADEYAFTNNRWVKNTNIVTLTDQFVFNGSKWNYDPSVVITLPAVKGNALSASYYQTITDWVWTEIDQKAGIDKKGNGFVTSYGNNEYYFGTSAYQNNLDFRPSAWRAQSSTYAAMSDSELTDLMYKRLPDAFIPALEKLNDSANLVDGIEVTYTIQFSIYGYDKDNKLVTVPWQIIYKVIGKGKFEYVADSMERVSQ